MTGFRTLDLYITKPVILPTELWRLFVTGEEKSVLVQWDAETFTKGASKTPFNLFFKPDQAG